MSVGTFLEDLFGLDGQVAVVIGGTGVLGGAFCDGLAKAGAHVVVVGRNKEHGHKRVEIIEGLGGKATFIPADVSNRAGLEKLLADVLAQCGRVDMLLNGAGVNVGNSYFEVKDDDWKRVLESNLTAVHWGCQVFGEHMVKQKSGRILNIGSVTADLPLSRVFAYSASKAAVVNLTQNVAREFAPHGVRVNCLCPGFFPAEQNRSILNEERVNNILGNTPMGRFGEPEELIGTMLLLLSRSAGQFITGATYYVDGGFTAARF